MKTFSVLTLGCKVNYYDSQAVIKVMVDDGYKLVDFCDVADVYIVNTCSVTNLSDKKSRQMLHRARKMNPDAVVVAMGCYAQSESSEIIKKKIADLVIGTNNRKDILHLIGEYLNSKNCESENFLTDTRRYDFFEEMPVQNSCERVRAFIKIQEGCDEFCSYCIIPFTRGKSRSRDFDDILNQVKNLCDKGFKEIVLTGINVSAYGRDLKGDRGLVDLLAKLDEVKNLKRIRLSSVEPNLITDNFLNAIKPLRKLCPHFHMSLQSGCDDILRAMNRKYTTHDYFCAVQKLEDCFENVCLTTDVIVGFPGESEENFLETCEFVKKVGFAKVHVFPFSPRKNTRASRMPDKVNSQVKKLRTKILASISEKLSVDYMQKFVGKKLSLLVEEKTQSGLYVGHTDNYIKVFFDPVSDEVNLVNEFVDVCITDINDVGCSIGKIV